MRLLEEKRGLDVEESLLLCLYFNFLGTFLLYFWLTFVNEGMYKVGWYVEEKEKL